MVVRMSPRPLAEKPHSLVTRTCTHRGDSVANSIQISQQQFYSPGLRQTLCLLFSFARNSAMRVYALN